MREVEKSVRQAVIAKDGHLISCAGKLIGIIQAFIAQRVDPGNGQDSGGQTRMIARLTGRKTGIAPIRLPDIMVPLPCHVPAGEERAIGILPPGRRIATAIDRGIDQQLPVDQWTAPVARLQSQDRG